MNDYEILKFLYKKEQQKLIDRYLSQAGVSNRIMIREYNNFKDYDLIPLIKQIIIKSNKKVKKK